ncbi:MAG: alpha-ketoacid dehydrogenase subunit beta [SAR324 cluster bacterium]|jgi:pyruvate dehydrogenase E1 component beta subunit|nr:alpha-ketoacid dehydrogenase subunit beta [Deltaproteobacteria bacterium]MAD99870.1 alpha-ketoacid dehydrogenase subunit beta [Pseudomonadota bacterium]MDP6092643.1 alpha-ketoacid dehydrogenase subunit beta [SAR324 cluster bacterium]MBP45711.1 alpha-ketoacid dehydrogenase subunit beta [Deltaproteobacteria bacterium]MDP6245189.1 alpha-ketoacid dehydrogenase subunit beta [SAR324 cluster bacterium]|tara:strand:- start:5079 stop:6053 length:975 start_codon:yes stop_codon:yes gene_type:complete
MAETTYREALRLALTESMRSDPSIIILGEEVGKYGGAYGVTKGMLEEFGDARIRDTPISEEVIVGAAVGAAMTGLRPVAELMYIDFVTLAMDQLVNQAAKIRYMFGGQIGVPMVLRSQGGTGRSGAAQHSQSLEAWMMHTPGLHLAMPSTVTDAYHLLKHSLTLNDPVVFLEHKGLYTLKGTLEPDKALPWGKAEVRRQGGDCTLVSYSRMIHLCMDAAETLSKEGISVEVIDLRTLHPLDMQTVSESVSRTGRAMVVTEDCLTAGVSAELSARIMEEAFDFLEEPVVRLSGEDIPIPVSPQLEQGSVPGVERIMSTVKMLLRR